MHEALLKYRPASDHGVGQAVDIVQSWFPSAYHQIGSEPTCLALEEIGRFPSSLLPLWPGWAEVSKEHNAGELPPD